MFEEIQHLSSATGANLALRIQPADGPAIGVLQICHGLGEHSGRYAEFAHFMAAKGFHVFAHDHRGHGLTTAPDAVRGRFAQQDGVDKVIADVAAVRGEIARHHPGLPVILFGHSMGGLIALNSILSHPQDYDGVAIWNSNFAVGWLGRVAQGVLLTERALKGSDVPSAILPRATFTTWGRSMPDYQTDADWLSRDRAEVAKYNADPLCGFPISISLWLDVFALTFRGTDADLLSRVRKTLPIHLVGGGEDPATDKAKATSWLSHTLASRGFSRISKRIYPDMRHETLKEFGREAAMEEFAAWARESLHGPDDVPSAE
ncbi:alpha/beta fold hydrolase [Rhizobium oryzicola]|uniref:Alpha/beta hydrolase n=1 Tax=Rhizobium oryzicola TaxID=1232668 RepID=A0ABT8SVU8_9HYPH|nr:alpha/beta hydrolase [Rhizobium oryzicola]MDO1582555.1 alpha/beta hydrolase [Rhizobium oryzicola]